MDTLPNAPGTAVSRTVTAVRLADCERQFALPRHFGSRLLTLENAVYGFMRRFSADYRGGFWQFYELSNGGFYMAPDGESLRVLIDTNGYEGTMSSDAAGITVCLFAYSHLSFFQDVQVNLFAQHFHQLREFAIEHAESSQIFAAID